MIALIYAKDLGNVIGLNNRIPWHIKEDLLFFKEKTLNQYVILGYNTYMSLKSYYKDKPLPYKKIFLITHEDILDDNVIIVKDPISFFRLVKDERDIYYVIGGASIYNLSLDYASLVYETIIKKRHDGDTFLNLDLKDFNKSLIKESDICSYYLYKRL